MFKTHFTEESCPKGGKYTAVVRHPYDVVVSQYKFFADWMFSSSDMEVNQFVQQISLHGTRSPRPTEAGYTQQATALEHYMVGGLVVMTRMSYWCSLKT